MLRRRTPLLSSLLATAVLLAAVACGGDLGLDPVAAAADRTVGAGSFRLDYRMDISLPNAPVKAVRIGGTGAFDLETGSGQMTFELGLPDELGGTVRGELILDGRDGLVLFMRFPALAGGLPAGKEWVKLDLEELGRQQGLDLQTLMQTSQADPRRILDALSESEAERVGYDTVRGVPTTRYRLSLEVEDLLGELPTQARESFEALTGELDFEALPAEAWVDDDGLLRRLTVGWSATAPGLDGRIAMTLTQELYDFGAAVDVRPPPPRLVVDAAALGR